MTNKTHFIRKRERKGERERKRELYLQNAVGNIECECF